MYIFSSLNNASIYFSYVCQLRLGALRVSVLGLFSLSSTSLWQLLSVILLVVQSRWVRVSFFWTPVTNAFWKIIALLFWLLSSRSTFHWKSYGLDRYQLFVYLCFGKSVSGASMVSILPLYPKELRTAGVTLRCKSHSHCSTVSCISRRVKWTIQFLPQYKSYVTNISTMREYTRT